MKQAEEKHSLKLQLYNEEKRKLIEEMKQDNRVRERERYQICIRLTLITEKYSTKET